MYKQICRMIPGVFFMTLIFTPTFANSGGKLWLYCEATRIDDGAKVSYTFKIEDGIAHAKYGRWDVRENDRELKLVFINEDGVRENGAFIIIDRITGELYHNAYNISIYRTQANDQPCRPTEQRF